VAKPSISKDKLFNIQSNPNLDAADTGVNPSTGGYLTKQERIAIFRKRKINADKVFNTTSATDQKIERNRKAIIKIGLSVTSIQLAVKKLTDYVNNQTQTDANQAKEDLKEDKRNDETANLEEKEGKLEGLGKKLKSGLLAPVEGVKKTAQGILGKLGDVFKALFLGFIANKALKMIQAHMSGDTDTFKEMRNSIFKAFAVVGGIFLIIKGGLMALPAIIAGLTSTLLTVGGAMLAFLISPAGLIALAVAAGIGGFLGLRKLFKRRKKKKKIQTEKIAKNQEKLTNNKIESNGDGTTTNNQGGSAITSGEGGSNKVDPFVVLENNKDLFGEKYDMVKSHIAKDPSKYDSKEKINAALSKIPNFDVSKIKYEGSNVTINKVVKTGNGEIISKNQSNVKKEITNLDEPKTNVVDLTTSNGSKKSKTKIKSKAVATTFPNISPKNLNNTDGYELYAIKAYGVFT